MQHKIRIKQHLCKETDPKIQIGTLPGPVDAGSGMPCRRNEGTKAVDSEVNHGDGSCDAEECPAVLRSMKCVIML